jgi:hypothetical protein
MAKLGTPPVSLAVRLRLASGEHEDSILELWLGSSYGSSVSESLRTMTSVEDWKPLLGDLLYTAMLTSRVRTSAEDSAVTISSPFGSSFDYRLRVAMGFKEGNELKQLLISLQYSAFPTLPTCHSDPKIPDSKTSVSL